MAKRKNEILYLHEEVLLLALQDQKGSIDLRAGNFPNVIAGAILAELLLADRICLEDTRRKFINVTNVSLLGESILDDALLQLENAKRRKPIQGWVRKLAYIPKLKERVAQGLCRKGILKEEESKILWIFREKRYPEVNPEPERLLLERIRKAIFTSQEGVDIRTSILVSLTYRSNLLSIAFSNRELRKNKKRIEKIINGELIGKATGEVIQAVQAATAIAAILPAITAASTASVSSS